MWKVEFMWSLMNSLSLDLSGRLNTKSRNYLTVVKFQLCSDWKLW